MVNGVLVDENNRALVLTFTDARDWNVKQCVYVYAVDDPRSEGDRVVVVQHASSRPTRLRRRAVRNVEVTVHDNDTPGVYVTQIAPGTTTEDKRTLVIEGTNFTPLTDDS